MAAVSDRNGVPEIDRRRCARSNAVLIDDPQARSSPAWWISSNTTKASAASGRSALAVSAVDTCW